MRCVVAVVIVVVCHHFIHTLVALHSFIHSFILSRFRAHSHLIVPFFLHFLACASAIVVCAISFALSQIHAYILYSVYKRAHKLYLNTQIILSRSNSYTFAIARSLSLSCIYGWYMNKRQWQSDPKTKPNRTNKTRTFSMYVYL